MDNERPLKVLYFNNDFNHILGFTHNQLQMGIQNKNIDRIMLIGNNKVYETELRSAPYYRSYNEDI